jgi:hypothetical protein
MPSHHHSAVMEGRLRVEDTDQQVVAQLSIQLNSTVDNILEPNVAFDDYERASLR